MDKAITLQEVWSATLEGLVRSSPSGRKYVCDESLHPSVRVEFDAEHPWSLDESGVISVGVLPQEVELAPVRGSDGHWRLSAGQGKEPVKGEELVRRVIRAMARRISETAHPGRKALEWAESLTLAMLGEKRVAATTVDSLRHSEREAMVNAGI